MNHKIIGFVIVIFTTFSCNNNNIEQSEVSYTKDSIPENVIITKENSVINYFKPIPYRKGDLWGFYNKSKGFITDCIYKEVRVFDDNFRAEVCLGEKWGVIDTTGEYIIQPHYNRMSDLINNIYVATRDSSYLFDKNGKRLFSLDKEYNLIFTELLIDSLLPVRKHETNYLININTGKVLYKFPYKYVSYYKDYIIVGNETYGMIDRYGKIIIPLKYSEPLDFRYGLALVKKNNKIGFINDKDELVIPYTYQPFTYEDCSTAPDGTLPFNYGVARVQLDGKYGYINTKGEEITKIDNDYASDFGWGYGSLEKDNLFALVDTSGSIIVDFTQYGPFSAASSNKIKKAMAIVNTPDYGKIDEKKYETIRGTWTKELFLVKRDNKTFYVDKNGVEYYED